MIEPWINGIAVGVFGFLTGGVTGFYAIVSGIDRQASGRRRGPRNWSLSGTLDTAREEAAAGRVDWKLLPRSGKAALLAFYGLIAVMIIFIRFSPVTMNWWAFLGSLFAGYTAVDLIFNAARKGKLKARGGATAQ